MPVEMNQTNISQERKSFENLYIKVRELEGRIFSDNEVKELPHVSRNNPHYREWYLRAQTSERILAYLKTLKMPLKILDLGCGNGWFTAKLANLEQVEVLGLDINSRELEQANRVFQLPNLRFDYGDIFKDIFPEQSFNICTINSAMQYFPDLNKLLNRLNYFLAEKGEIHILDSLVYLPYQVESTKERSRFYYRELGVEEMAAHYFYHSFDDFRKYSYDLFYNPLSLKNNLKKLIGLKVSPFPWIKITKSEL